MIDSITLSEFKMGLGRDGREQELESQHQEILKRISDTEMPDWIMDEYCHGHSYEGNYDEIRQVIEDNQPGVPFSSILMISASAVIIVLGIVYWIVKGCPWF